MGDFNRIEDKKIDFDVNVQDSFGFNVDVSGDDDLRRYRKRPDSHFSYWKLSVAILCAGLALFVVIKGYQKYEEQKQIEEAIKMINQLEREMTQIINPPKRTTKPASTTKVQPKDATKSTAGTNSRPQPATNSASVSTGPFQAPTKEEFYKDENGVWRNRIVSQNGSVLESATVDTLNAVNNQLMEGMQPVFDDLQRKANASAAESKRRKEEIERKRQAQKAHEAWTKRIDDPSSYERFDPDTAGEVKSEWEYFDDPR